MSVDKSNRNSKSNAPPLLQLDFNHRCDLREWSERGK
jgi:hypothetical protein